MRVHLLSHVADTIIGDDFVRGVSGGEPHRVSMAEFSNGTLFLNNHFFLNTPEVHLQFVVHKSLVSFWMTMLFGAISQSFILSERFPFNRLCCGKLHG